MEGETKIHAKSDILSSVKNEDKRRSKQDERKVDKKLGWTQVRACEKACRFQAALNFPGPPGRALEASSYCGLTFLRSGQCMPLLLVNGTL
jgi:hypothetical protein